MRLQKAEGLHVLGQFGNEKPAAEEAVGKGALTASYGDKVFALCAYWRDADVTPEVVASAPRHCFTA